MTNRIVDFPDGFTSGTSPVITDAGLTAHLADTSDAHDASAISNVPAGNLAATDVQAALNELQGDIDSLGTGAVEVAQDAIAAALAAGAQDGATLTYNDGANKYDLTNTDKGSTAVSSHESDVTAHPASSIVNTPSGNLAATDVQAALNELQTDINSRALDSDLTTHMSDTTTHGTTGNILGTSDTQIVTNKDIDGGTASNTSRITIPKDTLANITALTRKEGTILYATDTDKFYLDDGASLTALATGAGVTGSTTSGMFLNGVYNTDPSYPSVAKDGLVIMPFNAKITNVFMFNLVAGSGGTTELDVKLKPQTSGTFTSIFSTTPKITSGAGSDKWVGVGDSIAGCTAPILISSPLNVNSKDALRLDIITVQTGSPANAGVVIVFEPQ